MAICHIKATTGSRAGGQSAKAKSNYINREGSYAKDNAEVLHATSGNMPEWVGRPVEYWDTADTYERANGRLYKELQFALPVELTHEQRVTLAEDFAKSVTGDENLPYSLAIHAGKGDNPHCHLMISERVNDGVDRNREQWFKRFNGKEPQKGGAKKTDKLKPKDWLIATREKWADLANQMLEKHGHEARIDHRSNEDRGILAEPISISRAAYALELKGINTEAGNLATAIDQDNMRMEKIANGLDGRLEEITGYRHIRGGVGASGQLDGRPDRSQSGRAGEGQEAEGSPGENDRGGDRGSGGNEGGRRGSQDRSQGSQESGTDQEMANSPAGAAGGNRGGNGSTNRIVNLARLVSRRTRAKSQDGIRKPAVEKLRRQIQGASGSREKGHTSQDSRRPTGDTSKRLKRKRGNSRDDSGWER